MNLEGKKEGGTKRLIHRFPQIWYHDTPTQIGEGLAHLPTLQVKYHREKGKYWRRENSAVILPESKAMHPFKSTSLIKNQRKKCSMQELGGAYPIGGLDIRVAAMLVRRKIVEYGQ